VDNTIRIHDIGGSLLGKLDNRVKTTGNRFSEDRHITRIGEQWCSLDYEPVGHKDDLVIYPLAGWKLPEFDDVVDWIYLNYDRINSIGWEMLERSTNGR
jgi:hypothetical protein